MKNTNKMIAPTSKEAINNEEIVRISSEKEKFDI